MALGRVSEPERNRDTAELWGLGTGGGWYTGWGRAGVTAAGGGGGGAKFELETRSIVEAACLGCSVNPPSDSSNGFVNREGTVPARARLTFGDPSVEGISIISL